MENRIEQLYLQLKAELPELQQLTSAPPSRRIDAWGEKLIFQVADTFSLQQLNGHYLEKVRTRMASLMGRPIEIEFELGGEKQPIALFDRSSWLDDEKRFNSFIPSNENRFALEVTRNISSNNSIFSSTLALIGPEGSGKSHLIHALVHERPDSCRIFYATYASLQNQLHRALEENSLIDLKRAIREADLIIIEDLHEIGAYATMLQEELTHLLSHCEKSGRQLISSSRNAINELPIPDSLKGRLQSGLQVSLPLPDPELRQAYLTRQLQSIGISLSRTDLQKLYGNRSGSLNEIDSIVNSLWFSQNNRSLQLPSLPASAINGHIYLTIDSIIEFVAQYHQVPIEKILSNSRRSEYTLPRHIVMYIASKHSKLNKSAIARALNKSDHTTVIHAIKKIGGLMKYDVLFREKIEEIIHDLIQNGENK